ncbi:MAG: 1-deoxy-D-xylulose-5-phosphate reductoisomerase [Bacteroidetes bacterium QH_8_67_23]|nr:MAG: 1-deoxy-D-xylulose-5-phosphate reductoisomerase [Bacteroidetes bacterium QH_8_67_23]
MTPLAPVEGTAPPGQTLSDAPRGLVVLGATGSIGTQTLEVAECFPERFDVQALTAGASAELLAEQAREHRPACVVIGDETKAPALRKALPREIDVLTGGEGLHAAARLAEADVVVGAVVGFAGLAPVLAALEAGKTVALANKETLVAGGALVERQLAEHDEARLLPVDSEHAALFQCLVGENLEAVEELVLTASGGPFRERDPATFSQITPEEALDHPNWDMGAKVTVDSATMMNKGLEVIEARWLFGLPARQLRVVVHPQSVVHSMVAFRDGAVKAQLGAPDMKGPIQYALSHPSRWPAPAHERLPWTEAQRLDFAPPDREAFPCLRLAFEALEAGGTAPAILNAANEAAAALFLDEKMAFTDIPRRVEAALDALAGSEASSLDEVRAVDERARQHVCSGEAAARSV